MNIDLLLALGILGMLCILWAFLMVQAHRWSQDDLFYDAVNFLGSLFLVIYAVSGRAWPFVILNSIWALYSLRDVLWLDRWPMKRRIVRRAG